MLTKEERKSIISHIRYAKSTVKEMDTMSMFHPIDETCWRAAVVYDCVAMNIALGLPKNKDRLLKGDIDIITASLIKYGISEGTAKKVCEYFNSSAEVKRDIDYGKLSGKRIRREECMEFTRAVKKYCTHELHITRKEYKDELIEAIESGDEKYLSA